MQVRWLTMGPRSGGKAQNASKTTSTNRSAQHHVPVGPLPRTSRSFEQFQDESSHLRLPSSILVFELAFPDVPGAALLIDQVDGGPHALLPPIPVLMIRIEEHW